MRNSAVPLPAEFLQVDRELSQVGGMEVAAHTPEHRGMPPPLGLEAHVGVDLHDQNWLGRGVVEEIPG